MPAEGVSEESSLLQLQTRPSSVVKGQPVIFTRYEKTGDERVFSSGSSPCESYPKAWLWRALSRSS